MHTTYCQFLCVLLMDTIIPLKKLIVGVVGGHVNWMFSIIDCVRLCEAWGSGSEGAHAVEVFLQVKRLLAGSGNPTICLYCTCNCPVLLKCIVQFVLHIIDNHDVLYRFVNWKDSWFYFCILASKTVYLWWLARRTYCIESVCRMDLGHSLGDRLIVFVLKKWSTMKNVLNQRNCRFVYNPFVCVCYHS